MARPIDLQFLRDNMAFSKNVALLQLFLASCFMPSLLEVLPEYIIDGCPTNCTCSLTSVNGSISMNISGLYSVWRSNITENTMSWTINVDNLAVLYEVALGDTLPRQIDALLARHRNITELSISQVPLTRVPMEVCQLTSLKLLRLNLNLLDALPDDCFTRLSQLKMLNARENRITLLQVNLCIGYVGRFIERPQISV